mgnify:CR=1 FL=1
MPDNRYYYFKDAKGNRHTVNKAAFDNDREGFAKAFPGARMEVIDRKTGRRGDVDVKDAGRVGDFGAHLFTGQTVRREKYQPKTSLGKAAQRVAQKKWGKEESGAEPGYASMSLSKPLMKEGKESELVKGLREADALKRRDEEQMPIDYTKPDAMKQMVGRTRREQQTLDRRIEQAGREAGKDVMKPLREKEARLKTPVVDTGDADINSHVINTQEQADRQLAESGLEFANKHLDDYVSDNILNEFKTATAKGAAAESALSKASPFAYMAAGKAYNEALDPDKLLKHLQEKANADIASLLSNPKMQAKIGLKAAAYGLSPEEYVEKSLIPGLQAKLAADFDKSELSRSMPKSTAEYILRGVNESMRGTIMSMGMTSKKQRQYAQQGMAMTDAGENPDVNPGMAARVARGTLGFVADAPVFGAAGKVGAAVAGKVFGNGVAQTARIANSTLGGRIARMAGSGMVSQGITGVLYGSTNAAVQNYSTGDDTSIGNTVKVMAMGGLSEGASWATMGGIGGAVGAGIYNVSGVKRIPAKAFQLAMEGIGMNTGGNVAKMIEGHDTDWSIEGNLEACANVVALKLTHARLPKRQVKDGVKESYLDMVARNINGLMTSDGQRAAFGGYTFTNEEKEQLFGSASAPKRNESIYGYDAHNNPLTRKESLTSWAMRAKKTAAKGKGEESYKDTDAEFVKTAYDEIMADNTIPWDTKAKFSALVMGTVPSARPMMENCRIEGGSVNEYSKNGELLSKNSFKSIDERNSIIYSLNMKREDQRLSNAYGAAQIKDEKTAQATLEAVAEANGMTAEQLKAAMDKQPLRRSEEEQNACVALRKAYEDEQFVPGTLHAEQSNTEGKDVVEENGLGTETPNNEAASEVLGDLTKAEDALQAAMDSNDVLKEEYERMQKAGMSNPQIYMELFNAGLTQEQLAPLADYINALSKAQGMFKGTQDKIVETTQKHVGQWSYKGELNGEKQNGEQMVFVKDNKGRVLIVGAGDVAFDGEGRVRDGDMLSVYDPATREMDFVHAKDVTLERTTSSEEYAKDYQRQLEELNSTVYAEMQSGGEGGQPSLTEPAEPTKPKGEEGNEASLSLSKPTEPLGEKETTPVGEEPVATLADGTPVPMMKDSKGRETADYSQMSPEQGAEWMSSQFGENAEAAVDGQIKRAEKTLKDAEKIKVDYTGDLNDAKEAEAQKTMAVDAAKKELELYTNIKKAMTEKKVKAGMEKVSSVGGVGEVGSVGSVGVAREKFESGLRVVGNKRTRTLADGSKLRGHYEIVDADSLTPSHNANDGYKKSEGFPVNEEGRTINDRDYENDKQAQLVTDMIAMKYDGQAVDQVPVVTSDGIVVDGNGRTMAGQKAAKNGTDSAYLEALKENAENYGFTAEQIEQSGIKHPRLVLVSDEPMKYDTATFAKFNKNEKKAQGNTQQAVANSKKLSTDEIGTIISEIEGSGSLDAFFNNPSAINSLLTRLVDKGVIGLNEVAGLREGEDKLSAAGKDFVKNLLLGSVFSENTIRMMGADAMLKTKALNGIRAVTDNMKLGDYALMKEIDQAVQLLYEARQGGSGVDAYLRTPAMFGENAADRYDPISQAIALALEGKVEDFRELMMAYNRNAAPYADANQTEMFGERPTKDEFINEFLKLRNWKDYETRHSNKEGNGDAGSSEGIEPQARGGSEPTEGQREVDKAVKRIATEITKKTGIEVVTDEKTAEEVIRESEETDSNLKYHKETDEATLEELENGETVKVYRAMQVIDGKLYPPMAAAVNGKRVEANELGTWIRADENPDLAIPDIDPKTKEQKVDKKTGELKWKFKLDKGGKDATGKKATDIPAAYNPYWHTSRSPLNDQFKSAWIRPNIVVVECEVPVSELSSGYRAERAKDAVGEVDWKSGVVSGEVYKQTGRARKVILSRWCKPVRVLSDAEVAQRAKEFVGDAKVEIPENVLTPRQRIEFEKAGFKIGAPEKGVKKSDQILEALKRGLQIDNEIKEHRSRWAGGEVVGMKQLPDKLHTDPDMLWNEISQYHGDYITRKLEKVPEDGTVKFFSAHDGKWYFYSVDKNHTITLFDAVEASRENYELFKDKLKKYGFDGTTKAVRDGMQEAGYTGRTDGDKFESFIRPGIERSNGLGDGKAQGGRRADRRGMAGEDDGTQLEGNSEKQGEVKYFRTANGEVYGFTDGEKIYLDTKKMKPETPLHEYAHLWCDMLRRVNPKEWENVKKLFDEVEGLKEKVQKLYPELEGDALYEEMITTYSGREGTKKLEDVVRKLAAEEGKSVTESAKAQGFLEKVKEALTKYWKDVADVLGIHFTTAEEVADKVLADWAKGVDPRESEKGKVKSEKSDTKPSEASLGLPKPLGEKGAAEQEGVEPSKTNPLAWLAHTAEMFKDEQVQKAKDGLVKAKESGDAEDIKRATADMKQAMETKLRGNGIGLVERRRIIGREIGKILGEEAGKVEAEKIDKPWADMEFDEQVAETEKKPLDADEIKNSDCDGVDKANAVAYLNGDKNIINTLSYLTVYDNVRNRERDSVPSSGTEDGTQLDAADNAGGEGLGRTDSRPQGVDSGQLGRTEGDGNPERGESVQSGERVSGGESGEVHATAAVGEQGGEQVHGGASGVEPVSAGGAKPRGSRGVRGEGRDVRERGNEGSGNVSDEKAGEATGGRGIDSRNLSTVEQIDKEISDTQSLVDDLFNSLFDGRTKGSIISDRTNASIIPLASDHLLGKLGINKQKMAVYKQLIPALTKLGYLHIKKGVVKLNDWIDAMKGSFGGHLTKLGLSDEEVYDYIKNMWNSNIEVDGVTHKLSEWASILGTERMKKEIATPNAEKYKRQVAAEPIKVKVGDMKNIEETLPFLLPQQHEDVLRAETQFFGKEHADREHAYGKGYMFTNGTGTGKTFTGLGIAKRLVKQGKGRILIVTPSQKKVSDWIKDGHNLNMEIRDLDNWAKERGTTATTESGEGVVITTFANFGVNKKLLETKWDAVIYDESHRIMENKNGAETARSMQHYMVTNRSENHCFLRLQETNKDYQKMKSLGERFDAERDKEVKRIQDEYKASHPSATPRDVAYATSRMLPKERNGFTPGDYASFPKLGKIHAEFVKALSHYTNDVKPKLEAQAKNEWKDTKTVFLSATPFNTRENLDYAEGYIFKYPEEEKGGRMSGRTQFYLDHFGAAYKFRYNRLEQSTSNPEAVAKQEIEFSDYLQDTLGTMSGRIIDSPYDYSRDFPTVSPDHAEEFNQAVQDAVRGHNVLAKAYNQTIGDYNYGSALFETMKVANIIERIKAHLDAGRKVVIFHRRVETKEPLKPPFASMLEQANRSIALMKPGEEQKKAIQAVKDFRKKYADLLEWEQTLDYNMPREQIAKVFGKDKVLFFSGKESTKVKDKAVDTFNSDDSGKNIIVIQEASGKEGISLHDTTGKHQRVCITLALPQSPITALQIEGRTYRIGNKSNAIFEYPILGLNSEMILFGQKFNNQVSTTENLALGSQARNLRDSFANGILEHSGVVPIDQQGVGGKEFDAPKDQSTDGFDNAVLDYYSNQKLNSRNREGVDYFPTPEPLGYKMMEWANMGEGDTVLEPSAGHGAIARYAPKGNQMVAIEPSQSLFTKLQLKAGGLGRKFQNTIFENYDISNKHDVVVMNPPFGTAGATAIAHLGKAFKHLEEGGRVVALIPRGSTDKKFDKWIEGEKTAVMRAEVELPDIVFKQAGTNVVCRVVVVDKISNEAMRAKAGSVEKWNLGGHYDKIEDFFEDLRDVEMPDRIIDTNAIMMKKSKQTVKDLKELKNVRVDFNEGGINVRVRGDWKDYSIPFDMEGYSAEQKKKFLASTYETFEQQERQTRNETSQAVLAELKKLTCKLADMTEEEMQRYLKKKYEGKGVMYRIEHAAEVYNKAKGGREGDASLSLSKPTEPERKPDGRIVPADVDKKVVSEIEEKFEKKLSELVNLAKTEEDKAKIREHVRNEIIEFSRLTKTEIENERKNIQRDLGNVLDDRAKIRSEKVLSATGAAFAADRELEYRRVRAGRLRESFGLQAGTETRADEIERLYKKVLARETGLPREDREKLEALAGRCSNLSMRLGVAFKNIDVPEERGLFGESGSDRTIDYYIDTMVRTSTNTQRELATTLLHEMIHQATAGTLYLAEKGLGKEWLTEKQRKATDTIFEIYNKVSKDTKRFAESPYGLEDAYELTAQMADPLQRKAMDKFETIVAALRKRGDSDSRNLWQRFKDAIKALFEISDKDKMDKAIDYILDDFNQGIDDAAMRMWEEEIRSEGDKPRYASLGLSKPLEGRIAETVEKVSKQTGGKVKMVNSVEEIGNEQVRRDIENGKQVTGWYDENTGEVHLYMPNIHDSYTAEKTVWHETVGHKGMRGLLGDKFNDYMRGLWLDLDNPVNAELRAYVKERMGKDSMGFYDAIEEFIAESAEKGKGEPGFWNYIKNKVTDALHEIGYRISPNVKDVKYMLWLAKNVQKKGNDPWWKMRADAVKWKIEHENVEYTKIHGGEFYENDGKSHDFEDMSREEWDEATDGQIHYRTAPSAATALDRYHKMLDAHGYMATEAFMDNMLSLDKLMRAVDPSIKKIEDVKSSMNPYILQNTMQGAMSDKMTLFEHQVMKPLDKAMSDVLDSFAGKNTEEKIRECNLYMIGKHGLERNRVLFVRDKIREERRVKSEESNSIDALEASWKGERNILGKKLRSGQIDLREYYRQMDEWIVQNIDKDFKAEEHDYSGMHGLQEIDDLKSPYDDAGAIDSVMSQEAKMESLKKGSVDNLWKRIKDATDYSINSDYENGLMDKTRHDRVKNMFDWYVPLRKYDEATAEDVYGYISGDNGKGFIGETLMNAKGRKSLSDVNVLAQIGAMGNRAIRNGGQNAVKQAFARFVRNSGEQNLVKETKVWVEKKGTDMNGNDIWEEAYPQIPDNASAHDIATIVDAFETDMKTKQAKGEAKTLSNSTDIGFKFARAKNKSEHFVDVKIAGRTHRFVVLGNPRAAQALNGMLENSSPNSALLKGLKSTTRFMAQMATSYSPEFVMRNIIRDAEFASSNVTAKEDMMYGLKWARYYAELNPLNVAYNEGAGALKSLKWKDLKEGVGMGLYARYREGTLGNSKMERYFKEFMENGGETGWVQVKTMQEWEKDYKRDVSREHSKVAKTGKALRYFLVGNVENLNEVAENMARFATFCTSRDLGRSAVRSAYDAKQVSTNFNRHGSGDAIKTFKNGEMGTSKEMRRNVYGTIASYLRNYSMFFNAGVQSTHLLMNNVKKAPVGTVASMMAMPFGLGIMAAVVNNAMIASEDEKKRKGVKDPYGELPEYIRRNNLCIYKGGGEFVTIPLAIELRAFYGLGDIAAGMTAAKNVKSTRNAAMDAVGCMSQLLPVVDFMNSATFDKEPGKELLKGVSPTAFAPFVEWWLNSDWKGTPIRREGDYTKNRPAWMNAYSGTPEKLMDLNKWVNAKTNDVAPGNENMRGNSLLDEATDPAMLNHIIGTLGGGAATFITRGTGLVLKYADGREQEIETKDIPFLRSLMYTPSEQTSMARTKAKWYGYKESMEKSTSNYSMLKNKNVPLTERIRNAADRHRFEQGADYARIRIIKDAEKQMKRWNKMKRLNADDKKQVDFANKNIEMIMQKAVEQMDKVSDD